MRAISIRETLESIELQKGEERTARDLATRQREYLAGASAHMMRCRKQAAREKAEQLDYLLSRTTAAWYAALSERQAHAPSGPALREAGSSLDSPAPTCGLPRVKPEDRPKWKSIRNMYTAPMDTSRRSPRGAREAVMPGMLHNIISPRSSPPIERAKPMRPRSCLTRTSSVLAANTANGQLSPAKGHVGVALSPRGNTLRRTSRTR